MSKSQQDIGHAYDSLAWWYALRGFFILTFAYNVSLLSQLRFFGRNLSDRHLELAAGDGLFFKLVLRHAGRKDAYQPAGLTLLDYSPAMLDKAIDRLGHRRDTCFMHADATDIGGPSGFYDTANLANSIHCMPHPEDVLREAMRVLRPGGTLAVNALLYPEGHGPLAWVARKINAAAIREGTLVTPYDAHEFISMVKTAGFAIVSATRDSNSLNVLAIKPR